MILVRIVEEDLKGRLVVEPRQRIVERVVGKAVLALQLSGLFALDLPLLLLRGKVFKLRRRQGTGKVIALYDIAAHGFERQQLLGGFHAFGDGGHLQGVRQLDHDLQKPGVFALLESVADKLHVQLQRVNGQRGDHVQRGVAGAEIIHFDQKAQRAQRLDLVHHLVRVLRVGRLRDLQQQLRVAQAVLFHDPGQLVHQIRVVQVDARDIDGDGHGDAEPLLPVADLRGCLAPDVFVQLLDQAVFLKQGDEEPGTDHAQLRVLPTHQGLRAGECRHVSANVELGLENNPKLLFADGGGKVVDQLFGKDL